MRLAACVLAAVVAVTVAACQPYPYGSSRYDYGPSFERVPGYQPGQTYGSSASKGDYYRNYQGSLHPGPEMYP
jgi:hypothetical protein